jgi:ferritin-like metal-binding protein YciE
VDEAATLMNQTLEEEYDADKTLTELAESKLNRG